MAGLRNSEAMCLGEPGSKSVPHVVLLVEPNLSLASLVSSVLGREGFSVLAANTSVEALELRREVAGIELLVTDVFLPEASGYDLAARVSQLNPAAQILYLSSVSEGLLRDRGLASAPASSRSRWPSAISLHGSVNS